MNQLGDGGPTCIWWFGQFKNEATIAKKLAQKATNLKK